MVLARTDSWQRPSVDRSGSAIKRNRNFVLLIFSIFEEPSVSTTQPQAPPIVFEPRSGESWRDPFPMYKALRDHDPVHRFGNDRGEFWILSRFKDVFAAAVDAKTFSSAQGPGSAASHELKRSPVSITVFKERRELWLFRGSLPAQIYPIFLGASPQGDKTMRGDGKTPEGDYHVVQKKRDSVFHRFLGINYPNRKDADRAFADHRISADQWVKIVSALITGTRPPWNTPMGGFLGIHGVGDDEEFKLKVIGDWNWTNGCVAVTNRVMEELFRLVRIGTPVRIRK